MSNDYVSVEPLAKSDHETVARWLADPETNRWLSSLWRGKKVNAKYVSVVAMNTRNRLFLVRYEGIPCGVVNIACIDDIDKSATVMVALGEKALRGQGIMRSALHTVARIAFGEMGLQSLGASTMKTNESSLRLFEKSAFKPVGYIRNGFFVDGQYVDRIMYDLLPEDLDETDG